MKNDTKKLDKTKLDKEQGIPKLYESTMQSDGRIIVDPFGSWTGVPIDDILDTPVQDVDDLQNLSAAL